MTPSNQHDEKKPFPWHLVFFLGPGLLIYVVFSVYPLLDTLVLSLYNEQQGQSSFVGLQNFITLVTDDTWSQAFWNALGNNFKFFAIHMLVQNPIGLLLAVLLSAPKLRLSGTYRTLIFMPTMLSVVIIGFVWQLLLSPIWGISEDFLYNIGLGQYFDAWLGKEGSALITLAFISVWQFVGIPMMLIYATLLNIPDDIVDASVVDGANSFQTFWHIKLPLILPTIAMVSILTFVANFNAFELIYAVKGALAGPNFSTDLMGTFFYRTFFGFQLQQGSASMGAAVATLMFLIILVGVMLFLFFIQRRIQRFQF
ncbi:MAG: carbohydrate ABC transporter permease [Marinomonas foliarum]|jgi:raffinose/stachyose/melibiose transport system permease protein|uniref:Carbohydrate ABC transporter membrane protein 1 (CUT1 family) n=1 Tax=Marinomonas foliarum TaxID=491950 RepID=A0A368ZU53_9GAMM|nr:sugar ABC transporter permease [Marinomonas foliarum]QRV24510.1 sugar ABC transporter permease [Marinomonas foliarum]RCX00510.1 carbohydrate ABC transporter membrane protein 1 (CUT1 family) [Marinomonas foliarum]